MVLLKLTPTLVDAVEEYGSRHPLSQLVKDGNDPELDEATVGGPISHGQVIDISKALCLGCEESPFHLPRLLQGSRIHVPPPKARPAPSLEYQQLMARLRKEAEDADYARMTVTSSVTPALRKTPFSKFVGASTASAWDLGSDTTSHDEADSLREINAQLSVVINILVSVIACGVTFFLLLRYVPWSDAMRVLASMFIAVLVGVAEVVVYAGFIRRRGEAKPKSKVEKDDRTIEETWVIGKNGEPAPIPETQSTKGKSESGVRKRK